MNPDSAPQLSVTGLEKRFDSEFALSGIDVTVDRNEIVALLGPSGCGKTTTLRCIAGVESPDRGHITIGGTDVYGDGPVLPPERRDIGMVYQNYAIWPHKTVYENVVFPLKHGTHDVPADQYEQRVDEVLETLEILELKDHPATELSGGQQQRTALARSLVYDPDLLLLDEPLSNLDRELRKSMRNQLQRIQYEIGISMLYVTHDQEEAFYLADTVLIMNDGEIVERGSPRDLYQHPESAFTRQFIGDRNQFDGTIVNRGGDRIVSSEFIEFPLDNAAHVADGLEGGDVSWFLRPSDINVGTFSGGQGGRIEMHGTVVAEGILGDDYEITVRLNEENGTVVVHTEDYHDFDRGDSIDLQVKPQAIQVYPDDE